MKRIVSFAAILSLLTGNLCYASGITIGKDSVRADGVTKNALLAAAFYNENGELTGVKTQTGSGVLTVSFTVKNDAAEIKAFLWDEDTLLPLCDAQSKKLTDDPEDGKILVAYFSQERAVTEDMDARSAATPPIGNTATAARLIGQRVDGNLFEIVTVTDYPADDNSSSGIAQRELREDARPALLTHVEDMDSYDTVFLGFPIWWGYEPMAVRTFLEEYDFSGKTIIPFCMSGESSVTASEKDIQKLCPDASVLEGLTLTELKGSLDEPVAAWLGKLGF